VRGVGCGGGCGVGCGVGCGCGLWVVVGVVVGVVVWVVAWVVVWVWVWVWVWVRVWVYVVFGHDTLANEGVGVEGRGHKRAHGHGVLVIQQPMACRGTQAIGRKRKVAMPHKAFRSRTGTNELERQRWHISAP
jgi:hypothetical protein